MANITFESLDLTVNQEVKILDFNEYKIEVVQYLPIQKRLELISEVLSNALSEDTEGFYNPIKLEVFTAVAAVEAYTNIEFTEEEKQDIPTIYDKLQSSGLLNIIVENGIGEHEFFVLSTQVEACMRAINTFNNSFYGVIKNIGNNSDIVNLDIERLLTTIKDPESLKLLKEIAPLLGQNT